jgi:hypothetical protein
VVALDLYKYTFHRLQHAIPFLWAMHSFHHSANAVTFITGARHFWLERVLSDAFLPIMAILFLFGTAWVPRPDEYPATELVPPERVDIINSVIWQSGIFGTGILKNELGQGTVVALLPDSGVRRPGDHECDPESRLERVEPVHAAGSDMARCMVAYPQAKSHVCRDVAA